MQIYSTNKMLLLKCKKSNNNCYGSDSIIILVILDTCCKTDKLIIHYPTAGCMKASLLSVRLSTGSLSNNAFSSKRCIAWCSPTSLTSSHPTASTLSPSHHHNKSQKASGTKLSFSFFFKPVLTPSENPSTCPLTFDVTP